MKIKIELFWNYACASDDNAEPIVSKHYAREEIEAKLLRAGSGQYLPGQKEPEFWRKKSKNDWSLVSRIVACNSDDAELQDVEGESILVHGVDAERLGVKCTANLEMDFDLGSADEDDLKLALNDCAVVELRIPVSDLLAHGCSQDEIDECIVNDGYVDMALENWDSLTVCVSKA